MREHYIAFRNRMVNQLECDGPAECWHLTGDDIDAALATITDDVVPVPDGGRPSPSLPANWRAASRPNRQVFQRRDRDHYIVLGEGGDEWLIVLCSQGDRAYPAPLASTTTAADARHGEGSVIPGSRNHPVIGSVETTTGARQPASCRRTRGRAM